MFALCDVQTLSLKYGVVSKETYYERKRRGLCVKCGDSIYDSPSTVRCLSCYKKAQMPVEPSREANPQIETHDQDNVCPVCRTTIEEYDIGCRACMVQTEFSLQDAVKKLGSKCVMCDEMDPTQLSIASSDIQKPAALGGPDLYQAVCRSIDPPPGYRVLCRTCYWDENKQYISRLYTLFRVKGKDPTNLDGEPPEEEVYDVEIE